MEITVFERRGEPGEPNAWSVEAIEQAGDGAIYQAIFLGPEAEARATEYAVFKYGTVSGMSRK